MTIWNGMLGKVALAGAGVLAMAGCSPAQQQQQGRGSAASQAGTQAGRTQAGGMETRMLADPAWGVQAATVTMPAGWKFDGVAEHGGSCVMTLADTRWAASSADGVTRIQYYPQITYNYGPNPQDVQRGRAQGCLVTPYWVPEDFLNSVVAPSLRPGAEHHAEVTMTSSMPALKDRQAMEARLDQESHGTRHSQVGFGSVEMHFMAGGRPMAEAFVGFFTCVSVQYPGQPGSIQCKIDQGMSFTAPASALTNVMQHEPVQVKWTDAWVNRMRQEQNARNDATMAQTQQTIAQGNAQQNALHATLMAQNKAQYDAGVARNKAQTDAMHQSMVATANYVGNQNVYTNAQTGQTYKASNQYAHTYVDNTGRTMLQTNSAYAPGPDSVWQELQPR